MDEHKCVVGCLLDDDYYQIPMVTLDQLKEHIKDIKSINRQLEMMHIPGKQEEYNLLDYADRRRATDMVRFDYCPACGRKIDWAKIRRMRDG